MYPRPYSLFIFYGLPHQGILQSPKGKRGRSHSDMTGRCGGILDSAALVCLGPSLNEEWEEDNMGTSAAQRVCSQPS
jgi:hypothetical protein